MSFSDPGLRKCNRKNNTTNLLRGRSRYGAAKARSLKTDFVEPKGSTKSVDLQFRTPEKQLSGDIFHFLLDDDPVRQDLRHPSPVCSHPGAC